MAKSRYILGVDPGLRTSGYAVIKLAGLEMQVVDAGTIKASTDLPLEQRLCQIYTDVCSIFDEHTIDVMSIEQLYAHYKHPRTAILMGHARGMFLLAAAEHDVEVDNFSATRIKKSLTGSGHATKEQMQRAVTQQLGLSKVPQPADVADAMAIAMCSINERNRQEIEL